VLALITFLIVIAIVLTAARVAAVALEATGMARDAADFQARSALLGVGFTKVVGQPTMLVDVAVDGGFGLDLGQVSIEADSAWGISSCQASM